MPFVITTLSPGGAIEAEEAGLPVLRGDSARQHTLLAAGVDRAAMVVVPDDDPATAARVAAVARSLAPTTRIVVRTRFQSEVAALQQVGVDLVVGEELEAIIQLFADILRTYKADPAEIERYAAALRHGGYAELVEADHGEGTMSPTSRDDIHTADTVTLSSDGCSHASQIRAVHPSARRLRGLPAHRRRVGPPAHLHDMWPHGLLRQLAEPPRDEALSCDQSPDRQVDGAWRAVGMVLRRRGDAVREVTPDELRGVEVFGGLSHGELEWLAGNGDVLEFGPGEAIFRSGDPADSMIVILEGAMELLVGVGGQLVPTFVQYAGEVTGLLPFSRMQQYTGSGRAAGHVRVLRIYKDRFPEMLQRIPVLGQRLVSVMADRVREATRVTQQREKMSALGTLAAGLAHELNNPAAAVRRDVEGLQQRLGTMAGLAADLCASGLDNQSLRVLGDLVADLARTAPAGARRAEHAAAAKMRWASGSRTTAWPTRGRSPGRWSRPA